MNPPVPPAQPDRSLLQDLGALRIMLAAVALVVVVFAPEPGMETVRSGWGLITTGVLPAIGPMVFMVILLDMLMSRVLMSDAEGLGRRRYRRALAFDALLAVAILLSWLPFLGELLDGAG